KVIKTPGSAHGVDLAGTVVAVADGGSGVSFVDAASGAGAQLTGSEAVGGTSWDVRFDRGMLYVANEQGVAVIENVGTPPTINEALVKVTTDGASLATVRGSAQSVSGHGPLSVEVKNVASGASVSGVAVASDGSFTASVVARSGEKIDLKVTDRATRVSGRAIGPVAFANMVQSRITGPAEAAGDQGFNSRRIASDGTYLAVSGGSSSLGVRGSDKLLFLQPNASAPAQIVMAGSGAIQDIEIENGWAYVGSNSFSTVNLATVPPTIHFASDQSGSDVAVAVAGRYAFTAVDWYQEGRVRIYDNANPSAPLFVREQVIVAGVTFRELVAYGTNYLIGITPDTPGGTGHDVVVLDRRNVNALVKVADLDIPAFGAIDGVVDGDILYLAGADAGVAIVDLANPALPRHIGTVDTPGIARGIALSGPNEIVVADAGGPGVTFIDTSDKSRPFILGSQALAGNTADVTTVGRTVYTASDQYLHTLLRQ
ncbi:MAG TPA: hypothetical protein VNM92_15820, partial [Thermoanaerobaculia bacterium]|nr:hypothetical protein [Thermoanaerobaculia bacterium]